MAVCRCSVCGARQVTRTQFEVDCDACGAEQALVPEDAYDPEPDQLRCSSCGYVVDGGGQGGEYDEDYAGGLSVEDPCPNCGGVLVPMETWRTSNAPVHERPEHLLARGAARGLLRKHWDGRLPVDVQAIAEAVGLAIHRGAFTHEGLLRDRTIEVPVGEAHVAQRFAIAHETGHFELRHDVPEGRVEAEANTFASELLMPRDQLKEAVAAGLSLRQLRGRFGVSAEALHWALQDARLLSKVAG